MLHVTMLDDTVMQFNVSKKTFGRYILEQVNNNNKYCYI